MTAAVVTVILMIMISLAKQVMWLHACMCKRLLYDDQKHFSKNTCTVLSRGWRTFLEPDYIQREHIQQTIGNVRQLHHDGMYTALYVHKTANAARYSGLEAL